MKKVLLVKYGEIALRKGNRHIFERKLADTIRILIDDPAVKVSREQGRLLVEDSRGDIDSTGVIEKIRRIFGITAICVSLKLDDASLDNLKEAALLVATKNSGTFKIETKRADKRYPLESREVSAAIGEYVLQHRQGLKADMRNPEMTVWVEIRTCAYVYTEIIKCEAGLPYGSTGKGVLLLSGGIDSPVAGYMMAKRGVEIIPVYFHSPPYTSERALDKVTDIMEKLCGFIGPTPLYVVPFTETQLYIYENMPHAKLTLFLKRAMLRIATIIAEKEKAHCLINGDSVGQVASQTVQSIAAIDSASELTVLRPLAAMDKQQIIDTARQIDTYDISIRPFEDCCTVFVPKHPESKPTAKIVASIEAKHGILPELYARAAEQVQLVQCPGTN
ncbi:MAG: tRNA 4-thiouridine(8) synthase ThiI [Defluviitaleaceae bacterium]|nr:tRNA 4-thiouridine(8) synthase ThiI [Defluviitaleaceae bacterium]